MIKWGETLIIEAAGKMLDVTETGVVRAADACSRLGAWVVPYCYRRECARLVRNDQNEADEREQEEGIVRTIGNMAMKARRGDIPVGTEEIQNIAEVLGPTLHGVGYKDVFDPHRARLLENIAPLHQADENQ